MSKNTRPLKALPSIGKLLEDPRLEAFSLRNGPRWTKQIAQKAVEGVRRSIRDGNRTPPPELIDTALDRLIEAAGRQVLQRLINATGIILHTNFGRAPWDRELLANACARVTGYCNLEYDLATGERGRRGHHVRACLARALEAEDALVVNNNAAALLLILFAFARDREILISRSELVQIGGGFRIPDILEQSGARMVEVGTSNITTLEDYRSALTGRTAMILKVHQSNFHQKGFVASPSLRDLAALKRSGLLLVHDLGSGNLLPHRTACVRDEPQALMSIRNGADLVCFSGDKLLGACQAGIIAGSGTFVQHLAGHPLMRAVRPDKFTFAMLQEVLQRYATRREESLPHLRCALQSPDLLRARILAMISRAGLACTGQDIIETEGALGGGSLPGQTIDALGLAITGIHPHHAARWFELFDPPIVGVIDRGRFVLNFLTIAPDEEDTVADAIKAWERREQR
jgi:L-seryl-tRNA(Ser) seleniumtransferase